MLDNLSEINDEWNDDEFGLEFVKFDRATQKDAILYNGTTEVLYIKPVYDSIKGYLNQWNKRRKRITIYRIILAENTPYESDTILNHEHLVLDMGARLFNCVRIANEHKWVNIKILKISNPSNKFDVQYYASEYLLKLQKEIPVKTQSKKKTTKK